MWAQVASGLLGAWLAAAPALLGYGDPARTNDHIVGPLAAAFGIVAISEVVRGVRRANLVLGVWLLLAPWALGYGTAAAANSVAAGFLLIACARVRGRITTRVGGGWSALAGSG